MNRRTTTQPRNRGALATLGLCILTTLSLVPTSLLARNQSGHHFIVGGQSENRYPAVGAILEGGEANCTGTLITPTYVLTAAHCLMGSGQGAEFFHGVDARNPSSGTKVPVAAYIPHRLFNDGDFYDIGLVRLAEPSPETPIPYARELTEVIIGQEPLFIGYGVVSSEEDDAGEKRSVAIPITELDTDSFTYAGQGVNTCFGDSGGPALLEIDGSLQVIGVTSWGDDYCTEFGVNTRTDTYNEFIECVLNGSTECGTTVEGTPGGPDNAGPGGGGGGGGDNWDNEEPDDWCTDGDGWCDEPCDTVDSDCLDDNDSDNDESNGNEKPDEQGENTQDEADEPASDTETNTGTTGPSEPSSSSPASASKSAPQEEGGCAAANPADLSMLLGLIGVGIRRRRKREDQ